MTFPLRHAAGSRRAIASLAAAAAWAGTPLATAAGFSIGAGAGLDRGDVTCVASFPCDRSSTHAKLFAGYRFDDAVDVQATLFDAGRFKGGDTTPLGTEFGGTFEAGGFAVSGGYRWALAPSWSLGARAGIAFVRTRFEYANPAVASVSKTSVQPLLGLSLGYAVTPSLRIGVDYDATRFKVHTTRGPLQMLGLSAQYSF